MTGMNTEPNMDGKAPETASTNAYDAGQWREGLGGHWLAQLDAHERMLRPVGESLLARAALRPGEKLLDIGCGGGWTSRMAAYAVGRQGTVRGVDISPDLVAEAARRAKAEGLDQLAFQSGDAAALVPDGAPFDRMISRFGIMFFSEPEKAFAHLHSLLRPGGIADFAVWAAPADNRWMMGMAEILGRYVAMPPRDPEAPGPFALADCDRFGRLLAGAGFSGVEFIPWYGMMRLGDGASAEAAVDYALQVFTIAESLKQADEATMQAARRDLLDFYAGYQTSEGVAVPGRVWLVRAVA